MKDHSFVSIAALIGEPARAALLWHLADGRAYTASELAATTQLSPTSASNHLNRLLDSQLLKMEKQGKHRYYRLGSPEVIKAINAIEKLVPGKKHRKENPEWENGDIQYCRSCYDHLAGKVAVDLADMLVRKKMLVIQNENFIVTSKGLSWFSRIGIDVTALDTGKRALARTCLDWTERKYHIGGALGAALLVRMRKLDWMRPKPGSRIVVLTSKGKSAWSRLV